MTFRRKNRSPDKPTKKAIQAAINMQRPLEQDATPVKRKVPRRWHDDAIPDFGEKE